ncbi:hypothetical protein DKG71_37990 [Streptomyces sp. NEAU-S7GS2]|nr:hypothetical protein DKG71_37990 [Streptomyces sp. NEAU-S7GS2]
MAALAALRTVLTLTPVVSLMPVLTLMPMVSLMTFRFRLSWLGTRQLWSLFSPVGLWAWCPSGLVGLWSCGPVTLWHS